MSRRWISRLETLGRIQVEMSSRQPEPGLEPGSLFAETQEFTKPNHSPAGRWQGKGGGSRAETGLSEEM